MIADAERPSGLMRGAGWCSDCNSAFKTVGAVNTHIERRHRSITADRIAVNRILGLRDDPEAHGKHAISPRGGRVSCGRRLYKSGFAPCQLAERLPFKDDCPHLSIRMHGGTVVDFGYRCQDCDRIVRSLGNGKFAV